MSFQYIAIEGPIGVGKTSLAERLATRLDATAVLEESENPFLDDFYCRPAGCSAAGAALLPAEPTPPAARPSQTDLFAQTTVCDYLFDKDKIFAYLNLDDNELFIYQRLYDLLANDIPSPDLVVYLQAPTECSSVASAIGRVRGRRARRARSERGLPARDERGL